MSIIYEALKKAEGIGNKKEAALSQKSKRPVSIYLFAGLVVVAGVFIANIIFSLFINPKAADVVQQPVKQVVVDTPQKPPQTVRDVPVVKPANNSFPSLVLNGIFFSEDQGYALINNKIVKEGDSVDGAVLIKIGRNYVELKSQDSDTAIKLTLNSN